MAEAFPKPTLRPYLPADLPVLRAIFAASIAELAAEDYDEEQRAAWIAGAEDGEAFGARLANALTIVAERGGDVVGFASLAGGVLDLLFVHPGAAGQGVGTTLIDAIEKLAAARCVERLAADVSDNAEAFFIRRGYVAQRRQSLVRFDVTLANTMMTKVLPNAAKAGARPI
jgi:putative acetyltransferase